MANNHWQYFHPGELEQNFQDKYGTLDTPEKKAKALCELVDRGFALLTSIAQAWQATYNYTHPADQEEINFIFNKGEELASYLSPNDYATKAYGDFYTTYTLFTKGASLLDEIGKNITPEEMVKLRKQSEKEELKTLENSLGPDVILN
jgi:hypothetical protein